MKPHVKQVYSENNDFQYAETLRRNRQKRHRHREFFLEGVRPINQALAHNWTVNAFIYSRERRLSRWAEGILAGSTARSHFELPGALMAKLSHKSEPSELIALVAMPDDDLSRIAVHETMCVVVMDRPSSPGNLGAIIRSCDALRVDGVIITGHAVDVYDPETISATTGSLFAVPVVRLATPADLIPWFEAVRSHVGPFEIVGTDETGTVDVDDHDLTLPTVIVAGNEGAGMSAYYRELCNTILRIPISGSATSLNVACATSIILYERDRQHRANSGA
ncbi:MAG: TrmH family RNA methyltransferase [Anaerolineae bacterium]